MAVKFQDMTSGTPLRHILSFSLPLMTGNLLQQLYTTVDSIIVGQGVGVTGLAAVGASDWIYWFFLWSIHGFTQGLSVMAAQAFGSRDEKKLHQTIAASLILSIAFSLLLTGISFGIIESILKLLDTPVSVFPGAKNYLYTLSIGHIIVVGYNLTSGILRALGNSRLPLIAMIAASCLNIGLDLLFVLVFQWGIVGAAAATLIAQLFACGICIAGLLRSPFFVLQKTDWNVPKCEYARMCAIALPLAFQNGLIAVGGLFVQQALNSLGVIYIAAFTASNKLNGVLESVAAAFGSSVSTFMGQNYGARQFSRLKEGLRTGILLAIGFSLTIGTGTILSGRDLLGFFLSPNEVNAPAILEISYRYLVILCCSLPALFLLHILRSALQGIGSVIGPVCSGFVELGMRMGVALLVPIFGRETIFFAETAAWVGCAISLAISYHIAMRPIRKKFSKDAPASSFVLF